MHVSNETRVTAVAVEAPPPAQGLAHAPRTLAQVAQGMAPLAHGSAQPSRLLAQPFREFARATATLTRCKRTTPRGRVSQRKSFAYPTTEISCRHRRRRTGRTDLKGRAMQGRSQHSPGVNATENWVVRLTTETAGSPTAVHSKEFG